MLLQATDETQELVGIGLKDIIAVAMPDAVLIAHKDRAQDVKDAIASLKAKGMSQAETLPRDYRPWGWYESLVVGSRFQVKRIVVQPLRHSLYKATNTALNIRLWSRALPR